MSQQLKLNPLDLTDCNLVFGPVVELGGPGRLVAGDGRGFLDGAAPSQVDGDAGGTEGVAAGPAVSMPAGGTSCLQPSALCRP